MELKRPLPWSGRSLDRRGDILDFEVPLVDSRNSYRKQCFSLLSVQLTTISMKSYRWFHVSLG